MFSFLKSLIKKSNYEYLYFYTLSTEIYGLEQNIRIDILHEIQSDCSKNKKNILEYDIFTDKSFYETALVFSTSNLKSKFIYPLVLEIYAYVKKNKDVNLFTFNRQEMLFKYKNNNQQERVLIIHKFKVKC